MGDSRSRAEAKTADHEAATIRRSCSGRYQERVQGDASQVKHITWSDIYLTISLDPGDRSERTTEAALARAVEERFRGPYGALATGARSSRMVTRTGSAPERRRIATSSASARLRPVSMTPSAPMGPEMMGAARTSPSSANASALPLWVAVKSRKAVAASGARENISSHAPASPLADRTWRKSLPVSTAVFSTAKYSGSLQPRWRRRRPPPRRVERLVLGL